MMRSALWLVIALLSALLAAGFAGGLHPAGDSLAVLRVPVAVSLLFFLALAGPPRAVRLVLAGAAIWSTAQVAAYHVPMPETSRPDLVLYQQNLLWNRTENDAWLAAVAEEAPDFVTLQEVSHQNRALLEALRESHPYQHVCPYMPVGAVAILSRHPPTEDAPVCLAGEGLAALRVATPHGPVWVVTVHLHWPWPFKQAGQVDRMLPVLSGLDGHVVIAGDFNAVRWSRTLARIARASGTRLVGPRAPTFNLPRIGLPIGIDHVLTSPAFAQSARSVERLGSDHRGVVAHLARPEAGAQASPIRAGSKG